MAAFLFVTVSVAVLAGLVSLLAGHMCTGARDVTAVHRVYWRPVVREANGHGRTPTGMGT